MAEWGHARDPASPWRCEQRGTALMAEWGARVIRRRRVAASSVEKASVKYPSGATLYLALFVWDHPLSSKKSMKQGQSTTAMRNTNAG